jgi:hypothetical protein
MGSDLPSPSKQRRVCLTDQDNDYDDRKPAAVPQRLFPLSTITEDDALEDLDMCAHLAETCEWDDEAVDLPFKCGDNANVPIHRPGPGDGSNRFRSIYADLQDSPIPDDAKALLAEMGIGEGFNIQANRKARRLVKKIGLKTRKKVNPLYVNPNGLFFEDLILSKLGMQQCGIYWVRLRRLDTGEEIIKIAYTKKSGQRIDYYNKSGTVEVIEFKMLFNFHAMDKEADAQLVDLYDELMEVLTEDPELHACHRFLFQLIYHREGERLGLKRAIMLQVLESCCQLEHQPTLASPQEWLAFDEDMNETLH